MCVAEHRPEPLEPHRHHILPKSDGGPDTEDNLVTLCPTTHANAHDLLRLIRKRRGALTYRQAQQLYTEPVSRYAFAIARLGWLRMQARADAAS